MQDHRFFCPARGKWTLDGEECGEPMGREACAACFQDESYFAEILGLTVTAVTPMIAEEMNLGEDAAARDTLAGGHESHIGLIDDKQRVKSPGIADQTHQGARLEVSASI